MTARIGALAASERARHGLGMRLGVFAGVRGGLDPATCEGVGPWETVDVRGLLARLWHADAVGPSRTRSTVSRCWTASESR